MPTSTTIHSLTMRMALIALAAMAAGLLIVLGTAALPAKAQSAPSGTTITVNSDRDPGRVDGSCALREAIQAANTNLAVDACPAGSASGEDVIAFQLSALTITVFGQLPSITDSAGLVIDGGARSKINVARYSEANEDRIFRVNPGAKLTLRSVGVFDGDTSFDAPGGGIYNLGTLEVINSTIADNRGGTGGGIYNSGTLTIANSAISNNHSTSFYAGGISNAGTLTVTNTTIANNSAPSFGGGIDNSGTLMATNTTIANNSAGNAGGGVATTGANDTVTLRSTIVANNAGGNCDGTMVDGDYNIEDTNTCGFGEGNNSKYGTDPKLDPQGLRPNGGLTYTIALLQDSPVKDSIPKNINGCGTDITTDQRGVQRPQWSACDAGAFEIEDPSDTTPPVLNLPAGLTAEATNPSGAAVDFTATATDDVDGSVPVTCSKNPGATFPVGTTTVNCEATDAAGNKATGSFTLTVEDTTPPDMTSMPQDMNVTATSASGATVTYASPTATDLVDANVPVQCSPASNTTFALGTTTVGCSATDAAGNTANGSFKVSVLYDFGNGSGGSFGEPVRETELNQLKAGQAVPVKFGLGGDLGLNIFASGYPTAKRIDCNSGLPTDPVEETVTASTSGLRYDAASGLYTYGWKTEKSWSGTCRELNLKLADGTNHSVKFQLK